MGEDLSEFARGLFSDGRTPERLEIFSALRYMMQLKKDTVSMCLTKCASFKQKTPVVSEYYRKSIKVNVFEL